MRNDLTMIGEISMNDGRRLQVLVGGDEKQPLTVAWSRGTGEPSFAMSFTPRELETFHTLLDRAGARLSISANGLKFQRSAGTGGVPRQDEWTRYGRPHFRDLPLVA